MFFPLNFNLSKKYLVFRGDLEFYCGVGLEWQDISSPEPIPLRVNKLDGLR